MKTILHKLGAGKDKIKDKLTPSSNDSSAAPSNAAPNTDLESQVPAADPVMAHLLSRVKPARVRELFATVDPAAYTRKRQLRVLTGSYNVNGMKPDMSTQIFRDWLSYPAEDWPQRKPLEGRPGSQPDLQGGPDIVVLGFQEIATLTAGNVIAGASAENATAWDSCVDAGLNGKAWTGGSSHPSPDSVLDAMTDEWTGAPRQPPSLRVNDGSPGTSVHSSAVEPLFVQVACKQMVGLYLSVWVKARLVPFVSGVQTVAVPTGAMGFLGNKGAVMARMRVYDSDLVTCCAHLPSGEAPADVLARNQTVRDILDKAAFPESPPPQAEVEAEQPLPGALPGSAPGHWGHKRCLADHDNVLLMGDLNYRLNLHPETVRELLKAKDYTALLAADQLSRHLERRTVFKGWQEGPIGFAPTFKFHKGTNIYIGHEESDSEPSSSAGSRDSATMPEADTSVEGSTRRSTSNHLGLPGSDPEDRSQRVQNDTPPPPVQHDGWTVADETIESTTESRQKELRNGAKIRTPAYTDRILWRSTAGMYQLHYDAVPALLSDHMPVFAAALFEPVCYDRDLLAECVETARRTHDAHEMHLMPRCTLEPTSLDLGPLSYDQVGEGVLVLTNTGPTAVSWLLLQQPPSYFGLPEGGPALVAPPWIRVHPTQGLLDEKEATTINITTTAIPAKPLDCVLVLRLENGSDRFISIAGQFKPSCFGISFAQLRELPHPLKKPVAPTSPELTPAASGEYAPSDLTSLSGLPDHHPTSPLGPEPEEAAPPPPRDPATEALPPQLAALTAALLGEQLLATPGIFVDSVQRIRQDHTSEPPVAASVPCEQHPAVLAVRDALDRDASLAHFTPHQLAGSFLAMFRALPQPFLPPAAAQICDMCLPSASSAADLLRSSLSPVDWAVLRHSLTLMRHVLKPELRRSNGVSPVAMASLLMEAWFPPLENVHLETDVSDEGVQRHIAATEERQERRMQFILMFLDPEAAQAIRDVASHMRTTTPDTIAF